MIGDWYDEIIDAIESGLPRDGNVRQQFAFIVRTHLRLMLVNGTSCARWCCRRGGRVTRTERGAHRIAAPLYRAADERARARPGSGQMRADMPLRLLRSHGVRANGTRVVGRDAREPAHPDRCDRGSTHRRTVGRADAARLPVTALRSSERKWQKRTGGFEEAAREAAARNADPASGEKLWRFSFLRIPVLASSVWRRKKRLIYWSPGR